MVKYHEFPILDARNVNDQGIDANGVKMYASFWYVYNADGSAYVVGAVDDGSGNAIGYATYETARTAQIASDAIAVGATIKSGQGNLFGGSKDLLVQNGSFPALTEEGGMVSYNRLSLAA